MPDSFIESKDTPAPDSKDSRTRSGYLLGTGSALASGTAVVVGKWNLLAISPILMNSLIFSIASSILLVAAALRGGFGKLRNLSKPGWFWLGVFSLTSTLSVFAHWAGVQKMEPSLAAFLTRAEVPVAITCGVIFLGERFTKIETIGALLSILGIVVMRMTLRVEFMTGFWYVLFGSLLFGFAEFASKLALMHLEPLTLVAVRNTLMCGIYWSVWYATGASFDGLETVWLGVIALGFLGPLATRYTYVLALDRMPLSKLAVISQLQPVFVVVIALFVFGQLPTFREYLGAILISSGVMILVIGRYRHRLSRNHAG